MLLNGKGNIFIILMGAEKIGQIVSQKLPICRGSKF
jgi:hypothetical protein